MLYKRILVCLLFISGLCFTIANAQNFDELLIPFTVNDQLLENGLTGGLVAPQFSSFDVDRDGIEDLMVFDRNGSVLLPFINDGVVDNPTFSYRPEYKAFFPDLSGFVQFHDYNGDGKKDIFAWASTNSGIEVWKNVSTTAEIDFELVRFNFGIGNLLQIPSGSAYTQIYVSNIDIPSFNDIDGDGDLDILTFEQGGSYMYLYKNMVAEMGLPADTLVYKIEDICWGKFFESGTSESISLSDNANNCATQVKGDDGPSGQRHAGSTVLALDGDGDGDLDMLLGDLSNNGLVYLENSGTSEDAFMTDQNITFPTPDQEADIFTFLSASYVDVTNDGNRDLIVTPNNRFGVQNVNHIWLYKNIGTDTAPIFDLVTKTFLANTTLRMGIDSHVTFLDYNQDRLTDILVGNNGLIGSDDPDDRFLSLFLYENTGTADNPAYTLVDDDYLGLRDLLNDLNGYLAPTVGDLDNDGDIDIVVGEKRGQIFYFENTAGPNAEFSFAPFVYPYQELSFGINPKPAIYDLDADGLNDLIVGKNNDDQDPVTMQFGGLRYHHNNGTPGNPVFEGDATVFPNNNTAGDVFTRNGDSNTGGSAPSFFYTDGQPYISVGSRGGNIYLYNDLADNIYTDFDLITEDLEIGRIGGATNTSYADIDNDQFYELLIGNSRGGLSIFNTTFVVDEDTSVTNDPSPSFTLAPNPVDRFLTVRHTNGINQPYRIYDAVGRIHKSGSLAGKETRIDLDQIPQGLYFITVQGVSDLTEKFIKIK